ncbi:MAG TPA: peptidoglycan-associated lipoprotein Pal [Casimicrobiaceae bacterium]|nr:peptidoglycan-associated lipoprotein Pal [Casimicrobiaceae bacterium]
MRKILFAALLTAALAGCQTQPSQPTAPIDDRSATTTAPSGSTGASTAGTGGTGVAGSNVPGGSAGTSMAGTGRDPLRDPNSALSKRSVFFDFDSFAVKDEYRPLVEAHARYLTGNRQARTTVQGHTDERGSREYNIALGQRRADSIKRMMTLLGAQDGQIETVSFGKEKPRNPGHDESSWAQNRRGDIAYSGE